MKLLQYSILILFLVGCKSVQIKKTIEKKLNKPFNTNHFTGIFMVDPSTKDTLINYNGDKYFTPASNTKIITLYAALKLLDYGIPAYKFQINGDTIAVQGTGNPTALHPYFKDSILIHQLQNYHHIKVFTGNLKDAKYGPGWAWEDYDTYFSPEKSSFPLYGNIVTVKNDNGLDVYPKVFLNQVKLSSTRQGREEKSNQFYHKKGTKSSKKIPFIVDNTTTYKLWKDLFLHQKITIYTDSIVSLKHTQSSNISIDSLYKRMMLESDNFLAEQILLMSSSKLSDTLQFSKVRNIVLNDFLADLPYKPRWVDASGLSRYNLFTPSSFVHILHKLYTTIPKKRLFNLFPVGGRSGTLANWYADEGKPYVFAKSGTLGNNYNLSGFLRTKSNKILIFSFMNNHFKKRTTDVKKQIQTILEYLRDAY